MPRPDMIFRPFRLDPGNACLWRDSQPLSLTPKSFAVLCYLAERPDQLVTKEELLNAVWPRGFVSDAVLKVCVREIRKVLGDDIQAPRFIATVHRRGYRFIAPIDASEPVGSRPSATPTRHCAATLVGREAELEQMRGWLERASKGERQVAFITGEPGIGKTTLVEAFLDQAAADERLWIGIGQCVEHYGTGEAYLPWLQALSRLCRGSNGEQIIAMLDRYAPTWLAQLPSLLDQAGRERLQKAV
jgi:DNA-binding winged helix-turn-helix (wHTH) protein